MQKLSEVLRLISLSILFGGSAMVVFVAVTLVKSQTAQGIPVSEAAAANAPAFINYAKVLIGSSVALLIAEVLSLVSSKEKSKLFFARLASSAICIITAMIFSFAFVPPMEALQPLMKTDEAKAQEFHNLHENSRKVFGGTIIFALLSLLLPVFACNNSRNKPTD
jgi:hypothetical protein